LEEIRYVPDDFESSLSSIAVGAALFATTNADDIFLLSALFADRHLRARSVVLGQFLGIGALTLLSLAAALASLVIPQGWTALLGLIPLVLGIQKLRQLWSGESEKSNDEGARGKEQVLERRTHSQVLAVAGVTMANGGDNLAVYIPVFASSVNAIPQYVLTFAAMTGVWCAAGYKLVNNALVGRHIRRYGHILLPIVLIAIGAWILQVYQHCFSRILSQSRQTLIIVASSSPLGASMTVPEIVPVSAQNRASRANSSQIV